MNKKILAIAVAGAMAAPLAAQAGGPTVYGMIHVSIDSIDMESGAGASNESQTQVTSQSSRIGFKGDEDLGNGMKAIYKIESSIDVTGESGTLGARNRYVGLSGNFGTVLTGYHDLPIKSVGRKVDLFPEMMGDNRNILSESTATVDARGPSAIVYVSPKMNGLGVSIAYSADTNANTAVDDNDTDAWSAGATYSNGPLYVGLGYLKNNTSATADETAWRLSGSYKFGAFQVLGLYQDVNDAGGVSGRDSDAWGLGGAYTFGNNVVKFQYYDLDDDRAGYDADMWAIGMDHNFSKRTKVYVAYADADNETSADVRVNSGGRSDVTSPLAGQDPNGFSLGIIHKF